MFDLIYSLGIIDDAWDLVRKFYYYIMILINGCIYSLINTIYRIYIALASAQLLTTEMFNQISNRVYALVGVFMLFVLAYAVIQGIVAPDKFISKSGGEGGAIVKRVIIAVLGIALVPGVFRLAYEGQKIILDQNIIGKIFLDFDNAPTLEGGDIEYEDISVKTEDTKENDALETDGGTSVALNLWIAFFHPTETADYDKLMEMAKEIKATEPNPGWKKASSLVPKVACGIAIAAGLITTIITGGASWLAVAAVCGSAVLASEAIVDLSSKEISLEQAYVIAGSSGDFSTFLSFAKNIVDGEISFNPWIMLAVGIVALYLFTTFAIDMAVRAVKLAYMQLIAPIPLILQIMPKFKDNFNNWLKKTIGLFVEVFIRLTFIYVVIYLIAHIDTILGITVGEGASWLDGANLDTIGQLVAKVILIMGFLIFCKTAPGFISETLGIGSGKLDLGIKDKLANGGLLGAGAALGGLGATTLVNASTAINRGRSAARNLKGKNGKDPKRSSRSLVGIGTGVGSFLGGTVNNIVGGMPTYARSARAAKSFKDVGKGFEDARKRTQDAEKNRFKSREERDRETQGKGVITRYVSYPLKNAKDTAIENFMDLGNFGREVTSEALKQGAEARKLMKDMESSVSAAVDNTEIQTAQVRLDRLSGDQAMEDVAREIAREKGDESKYADYMGKEETFTRLAKKKKEAEDAVKQARHNAVNKGMLDAMAGNDTKEAKQVLRATRTFIADNAETINKLKDVDLGNGVKFGDKMEQMFGKGVFEGKPVFNGTMMGDLAANLTVKLSDGTSLTSDKDGNWTHRDASDKAIGAVKTPEEFRALLNGKSFTVTPDMRSRTEGTNILASLAEQVSEGTVQNIRVDGIGDVRVEKSSGGVSYSTLVADVNDATRFTIGSDIKLVPSSSGGAIEAKVEAGALTLEGGIKLDKTNLRIDPTSQLKLSTDGVSISGVADLGPIQVIGGSGSTVVFDGNGQAKQAIAISSIAAGTTLSIGDIADTFARGLAVEGTSVKITDTDGKTYFVTKGANGLARIEKDALVDVTGDPTARSLEATYARTLAVGATTGPITATDGKTYFISKKSDGSVKVEKEERVDVTHDSTVKNARATVDLNRVKDLADQARATRVSGLRDASGDVADVYFDGTNAYQAGDSAAIAADVIDIESIVISFIKSGKVEMEFVNAGHTIGLKKVASEVHVSMDGVEIGVYDSTGFINTELRASMEIDESTLNAKDAVITEEYLRKLLTDNSGIAEVVFRDGRKLIINRKEHNYSFNGRTYSSADVSTLYGAIGGTTKIDHFVFVKKGSTKSVVTNLSDLVKNAVDKAEGI